MAFLAYDFNYNDTFEDVAAFYGTTVSELLKINNLPSPPPTYIREAFPNYEQDKNDIQIKVPIVESPYMAQDVETLDSDITNTYASERGAGLSGLVGFASQNKCFLVVEGVGKAVFPCYPESYSDSHQASFGSQTPLGRSEPFQIYQNSGPRTVNVSFRMDREMTHTTPIGEIVGIVQAACYPVSQNATITPRCTLVLGANCSITGVISNVSTNWSDTIIANQYMIVTLDFSVTECTGNPRTAGMVKGRWGV